MLDSYSWAICSNRDSLNVGPSNCNPIGRGLGPLVNPHGKLIPGIDAILHVTVNTSLGGVVTKNPFPLESPGVLGILRSLVPSFPFALLSTLRVGFSNAQALSMR